MLHAAGHWSRTDVHKIGKYARFHPADIGGTDRPLWFGGPGVVRSLGATPVSAVVPRRAHVLLTTDIDQDPGVRPSASVLADASGHPPENLVELATSAVWDAVAVSFGPGKPIDAGEGGAIVFRRRATWRRALEVIQHPMRQHLSGIERASADGPALRIHPVAAVTALHQLSKLALAAPEAPRTTDPAPAATTATAG